MKKSIIKLTLKHQYWDHDQNKIATLFVFEATFQRKLHIQSPA
jgi:hypothetical protein